MDTIQSILVALVLTILIVVLGYCNVAGTHSATVAAISQSVDADKLAELEATIDKLIAGDQKIVQTINAQARKIAEIDASISLEPITE